MDSHFLYILSHFFLLRIEKKKDGLDPREPTSWSPAISLLEENNPSSLKTFQACDGDLSEMAKGAGTGASQERGKDCT